jgi:hypothetical protein
MASAGLVHTCLNECEEVWQKSSRTVILDLQTDNKQINGDQRLVFMPVFGLEKPSVNN